MTSDRSQAYGRVTKLLDDLSAAKLHPTEQQIIRDAADSAPQFGDRRSYQLDVRNRSDALASSRRSCRTLRL